jgi:hypothetical protein
MVEVSLQEFKVTAPAFPEIRIYFRKHTSGSIQLDVDGVRLVQPSAGADVFTKHFQSVYS